MKTLRNFILTVLILVGGWWLLSKMEVVPSIRSLFKPQPVTIEQTGVWVKEIKALAQLVTVSAYDELVADTTRSLLPEAFRVPSVFPPVVLPRSFLGSRRLVLVGKTTTHVGINMQAVNPEHIAVTEDSIHLTLPRAQVLDVIVNPSDVDVFIEDGAWSGEAIAALKNNLRQQAAQKVAQRGLLQQAQTKATSLFTRFFEGAGFKKVTVAFR